MSCQASGTLFEEDKSVLVTLSASLTNAGGNFTVGTEAQGCQIGPSKTVDTVVIYGVVFAPEESDQVTYNPSLQSLQISNLGHNICGTESLEIVWENKT